VIRDAIMTDIPAIHGLITCHAERDRMLFRSYANLYEHLRDFTVFADPTPDSEQILGCVALELVWRDLAEIKSLAVESGRHGTGIGRQLVEAACDQGRRLALDRVFALTREPNFFRRLGFHEVPKDTLPHKVWSDCVRCPHQEACDEVAMMIDLDGGT